jgi:uncharacterized repeat protein (TIGR01451 family)
MPPSPPMIETWDGSSVTPVASPTITNGDDSGVLASVSCVTTFSCTAAGYSYTYSSDFQTQLIESWDGSSWTVSQDPALTQTSDLSGVSCESSIWCVAVGNAGSGPLVEQWDGSTWSAVTTSGLSPAVALNDISCVGSSWCTADGATNADSPSPVLASNASTDISASLQLSPTPAQVGGVVNAAVTIVNSGPDGAGDVQISNLLPAGGSLVNVSTSQGSCSAPSSVTCDLGGIAQDASASVRLSFRLSQVGQASDTVSVSSSSFDPNSSNNTAVNSVRVGPAPATIGTIAGDGSAVNSGDGGPAVEAKVKTPYGVAVDESGDVFFSESNQVQEISATGTMSTVLGGGTSTAASGAALTASLDGPAGVAVDSAGDVFVADNLDDRVLEVTPAGAYRTIAGNYRRPGSSGDGGKATAALLKHPLGVAVDGSGNVYIADTGNDRVQLVRVSGVAATLTRGSADVPLGSAVAVAVDRHQGVYIADKTGIGSTTSPRRRSSPSAQGTVRPGLGSAR